MAGKNFVEVNKFMKDDLLPALQRKVRAVILQENGLFGIFPVTTVIFFKYECLSNTFVDAGKIIDFFWL